jgi:hypothetical protein
MYFVPTVIINDNFQNSFRRSLLATNALEPNRIPIRTWKPRSVWELILRTVLYLKVSLSFYPNEPSVLTIFSDSPSGIKSGVSAGMKVVSIPKYYIITIISNLIY